MHTRITTALAAALCIIAAPSITHAQQASAPPAPAHSLIAIYNPGQGVALRSDEDAFLMRIWTRAQLRATGTTANDDHDAQETLEIRRASLFVAGHAYSPHLQYFAQLIFTPRELQSSTLGEEVITHGPLFDMFFTADALPDLSLRAGLFKPFYSRQFIGAWGDMAFVDRPGADGEFRLERDTGFDLYSLDLFGLDLLRYHVGLFSGHGRDAISTATPALTGVARLEVLPLGMFDDYVDADLNRTPAPKLAVAVAGAYQRRAPQDRGVFGEAPADGGATNLRGLTADAIFKWRGLSAQGAFFVRRGERVAPTAGLPAGATLAPARDALGGFGQLGYVLPNLPLEVGARYDRVDKLGDDSSADSFQDAGAQVSYYLLRHSIKLQADLLHLWAQSNGRDDSDQLRVQLQMTL
jgi:hypothetical protein